MENVSIADSHLINGSYLSREFLYETKLDGISYWCGWGQIWPIPWLQVDLLSAFIVTELQIQGLGTSPLYVTSLSVETGLAVTALRPIVEAGTNITKVNTDVRKINTDGRLLYT